MKDRLLELKRLMTLEGLEESAQLADEIMETGEFDNSQNTNENAVVNRPDPYLVNKIPPAQAALSEETIYKSAVKSCKGGRFSSSSEEDVDSSSELIELNQVIQSIAGKCRSHGADQSMDIDDEPTPNGDDEPGTSSRKVQPTAEQRAEKLIKEAEAAKGKIFATTGNKKIQYAYDVEKAREMIHSVLVDEEYSAVGGHLDDGIVNKIKHGEYVDFAKLLPRDRIAIEEDNRLQPVLKDGQVFWQPPAESGVISSYIKWEVAFKVFAKIYTKYHPHHASELIQYSHDIHAASLTFTWDNVYLYDKEFRLHLARHPMRSWGVILQHAWNLKLKDRIGSNNIMQHFDKNRNNNQNFFNDNRTGDWMNKAKILEPCHRYNRGKCNFGNSCKYEHRCSYCTKFGHGILVCQKLNSDKDHKWTGVNKDTRKSPEGKAMMGNIREK